MSTAGKNELYVLLNSGVVNIHATADQPSNPHAKNLADLERDVATLTVMRNNLELLMDGGMNEDCYNHYLNNYTHPEDNPEVHYNACPVLLQVKNDRSNGLVFPLSEFYIDSTHRNWLYRCEIEDTLMDCKIILNEYYAYVRSLSQIDHHTRSSTLSARSYNTQGGGG